MSVLHTHIAKIVVSLLIAWHLLAIFIAPASVAPTSPLILSTWSIFRPYLQAANLNHGYHFFAPEPGSSSLLSFVGRDASGQLKHGVLPDKQAMRPRLLYHRYFMLTEYLGGLSADDPQRQQLVASYANELMQIHGLQEITLKLLRHRPATRQEVLIGTQLTATESYEEEQLGSFKWSDIDSQQR